MQAIGAYGVENVASTVKSRDWKDATDLVVGALDSQCGFPEAAHQSITSGHLVVHGTQDPIVTGNLALPLGRNGGKENALIYEHAPITCSSKQISLSTMNDLASTIGRNDYKEPQCVAYALAGNTIGRKPENGGNGDGHDSGQGVMYTLTTADLHAVAYRFINWIVRRLTPVECERLQGFPDNYTRIKFGRKSDYPDAPRYAALGNSFAVPVVAWIGSRLRLGGDL